MAGSEPVSRGGRSRWSNYRAGFLGMASAGLYAAISYVSLQSILYTGLAGLAGGVGVYLYLLGETRRVTDGDDEVTESAPETGLCAAGESFNFGAFSLIGWGIIRGPGLFGLLVAALVGALWYEFGYQQEDSGG